MTHRHVTCEVVIPITIYIYPEQEPLPEDLKEEVRIWDKAYFRDCINSGDFALKVISVEEPHEAEECP